jgi:hypothetical protein
MRADANGIANHALGVASPDQRRLAMQHLAALTLTFVILSRLSGGRRGNRR